MGKKIFGVLLTLFLVLSAGVTVGAAALTADGESVEVPVKYTVDNTEYMITIPAELTVGNEDTSFQITSQKMNLRPDEEVIVRITGGCDSNGAVALIRQQSDMENAPYLTTILCQNGVSIARNDYVVGRFKDSDNSITNLLGDITMSAPVIDENAKAGDYIGTIQFKIELRKVQNEQN